MKIENLESSEKNRRAKKMMLWFGMISITMTFAGLTSAYVVSNSRPDWVQNFELPTALYYSTIVLLLSSLSFWWAKRELSHNHADRTLWGLLLTMLLALFFVALQLQGFHELISNGYYFTGPQSAITSSFLYVLTVVHLLHLFAGIVVLSVVIFNHLKGKYQTEKLGFELAHTFWHFLDFLWLYLFLFLYFFR